jgi:hypothetical protein
MIDQFADAVWIAFNANGTSNRIGCMYISGTPETVRQRDKPFHAVLRQSAKVTGTTHVLVMGDFNRNIIM